MSLTALILAAGKATRMKTRRPKALLEVCGKPMLYYILRACYGAGCERIILVVGHGKDEVIDAFSGDKRIQFVEQVEQHGTGHAAQVCEPLLKKIHGDVFMLAGDVPLVQSNVLTTLHREHKESHASASMATAVLDDPTGYGRVVRDESGEFVKIVEQIDCTPQQREIKEVFPSYYCVKVDDLLYALSKITNDNKKHEYYLTDIYAVLRNAGKKIVAVQAATYEDVLAPNTRQQLCDADIVMQDRIQRALRDSGVSIPSPTTTYVEDGVLIGRDTVLEPFSFIGRDSNIGADCCIGPFASVPREGIVPDGTTIAGNLSEQTTILTQRGS